MEHHCPGDIEKLKEALTTTLVLALPNFSKEFRIEADACGEGIRAILMQDGIACVSKTLSPNN